MLGSLISGVTSLFGGLLGKSSADKARDAQAASAAEDRALQKEFAQSGIQWKVEDAKKAGIHPLYALGAQTPSYSPINQTFSGDNSMGNAVAQMGQDIGRAAQAALPTDEKVDAFNMAVKAATLQKMGLENELLASQIAKMRVSLSPGIPTNGNPNAIIPGQNVMVPSADKFEDRPLLAGGGTQLRTDPGTSNAEDYETRHGELGGNLAGLYVLYRDLMHHFAGPQPGFQKQYLRVSRDERNSSWDAPVPRWIPRVKYK